MNMVQRKPDWAGFKADCRSIGFLLFLGVWAAAATPRLHAEGTVLKDSAGNVVVLRGVSLIDVGGTEKQFGGAIRMIDRLTNRDDPQGSSPGWYPKVIRIPIYPPDEEDYKSPWTFIPGRDDFYEKLLRPVVDYCKSKDLYAIVDWHYIGNTFDHRETTRQFWEYMAPRFAEDSHVIFELFNEPINKVGTDEECWLSVRKDMQEWVNLIRQYAPRTLLLIAGANYSQIIGPAADYPIDDPIGNKNYAIVSHIYPMHWLSENAQWYKDHILRCVKVHPVFLSEWGFSRSFRRSRIPAATVDNYARPLLNWAEQYKISSTCWAASYDWNPKLFNPDWTLRCGPYEMGCFLKDYLYEKRNDDQPAGANEPSASSP
ncbi:MAG TPA: cellulase family glycosylhydrolase [Anaerohalosphaeraceae bacterium]|nr:cellulase family glycosylhydrolase [Anaerohalosphaeraceae bacterium]HOL89630.1 cellulase family glycosylhydrolase [Anaerohalosphaeraceae bacterium]HPP57220.1 cellulase family glycosylhydrolase [Anaerohalosphaeraceae bacterium]